MICPMLKGNCKESECAFWQERCSMASYYKTTNSMFKVISEVQNELSEAFVALDEWLEEQRMEIPEDIANQINNIVNRVKAERLIEEVYGHESTP